MSDNISTAFVQTYTTNVAMLLQQSGSRFRSAVQEQHLVGKAADFLEQFGSVNAVRNSGRHSDTPLIELPQDRRWIHPNDYDWAELIDDQDKLRTLIDPTSPYAKAGANALGRGMDDEIMWGLFNANLTGENGTTSTGLLSAYGSGSQVVASTVGASAATGLNVAKLRAAKKILMLADLDLDNETLYMAISAEQHDDLMGDIQVTNKDYTDRPVLVDGKIQSFMGFNFIPSERIPGAANFNTAINPLVTGYTTGSLYLCPFWAKSGLAVGIWNDIVTNISVRNDKRMATQVYVKGTFGGARTEEKRCGIVTCV
jgi:hypothetical protein